MVGPSAAFDAVEELRGVRSDASVRSSVLPTLPCQRRAPAVADAGSLGGAAEDPPASLPWCVDRGDALQAMSTPDLWRALEVGEIPPDSRVWREGMECWTPAQDVRELRWTLSERDPEAGAGDASGARAAAPVSVALTPADLEAVTPRWKLAEHPPKSTQEERAEMPTLPSARVSPPAQSSRAADVPLSLSLPDSFPAPPSVEAMPSSPVMCAPASVREAVACEQEAAEPAPLVAEPAPQAAGPAPQAATEPAPALVAVVPASGRRSIAAALRPRVRDVLYIAAGAAIATLAVSAATLSEPSPSQTQLVAQEGIEQRSAEASAGLAAALGRAAATLPATAADRPDPPPHREQGQYRLRRGRPARDPLTARPRGR